MEFDLAPASSTSEFLHTLGSLESVDVAVHEAALDLKKTDQALRFSRFHHVGYVGKFECFAIVIVTKTVHYVSDLCRAGLMPPICNQARNGC